VGTDGKKKGEKETLPNTKNKPKAQGGKGSPRNRQGEGGKTAPKTTIRLKMN